MKLSVGNYLVRRGNVITLHYISVNDDMLNVNIFRV